MRIIDLETINQAMDNETQFVLRCEEVFHDKVSSAAAAILSAGRDRRIVALTGPSGSGKTTTAMRLREYLENLGVKVCLLSMDNFFLPLDQRPPEATDWESPYCVNVEQLVGCIGRLLDGEEADIPWYDFKTGTTGGYNKMQGNRDCVVIAEGIHMLNPLIFDKLRGAATGIYVAPRTRILTNKDRVVRPEQLRVARRLIRTTTPAVTPCGRRWSVPRASTPARSTTSSRTRATRPSTSTPSTTTRCAFWPNTWATSPISSSS